jgi:hypothetical protein
LTSRLTTRNATLAYVAIAIAMTWPLARIITTALPADLGDPGFNCWILLWTGGQVIAALSGHPAALLDYWNGNIFAPAPLTVAYSEHLTPQMLEALPFLAATGNVILAYNVIFLSTFVLAGLGMFLLVRAWTGQPVAAFLAGLAFAYAPYRLGQLPHLQVLSTQWMPFVLYGLRRFFDTRRARPLAGAGLALVLQNLSCGYYLLFFPPFAAAYALYEILTRRVLRDRRVWLSLAAFTAVVVVLTAPFVIPYFRLRDISPVGVRSAEEISTYSADVHAFVTPPSVSRFWAGRLPADAGAEGEGFPGLTILVFAAIGVATGIVRTIRQIRWRDVPVELRVLLAASAIVFLLAGATVLALFAGGPVSLPFSSGMTVMRGAQQPLQIAGLALLVAVALTAWCRRRDAAVAPAPSGFSAIAMLTAALFALGPRIESAGHRLAAGPYGWLVEHVPGFDGLRVPARLLMIVALFAAALAGIGAAALLARRRGRPLATALVALGCVGILAESFMAPMPTDQPLERSGLTPVRALYTGERIPAVYRVIEKLPGDVVLLELPIGSNPADIPAVFYAGYHRRPLVNGYSGFAPDRYFRRADILMRAEQDPPEAMSILHESGVTHVLVHEAAFTTDRGAILSNWLRDAGARLVVEDGPDKLLAVR